MKNIERGKRRVDLNEIANELIEVKEMLEILQEEYNIPDLDPLWLDPINRVTHILEEIE
jgi:hypothetical protein